MQTTSGDVLDLFEDAPVAREAYQEWLRNVGRRGVHEVALEHVSRHVYDVTPEDVETLARRIKEDSDRHFARDGDDKPPRRYVPALHPLGKIRAAKAGLPLARDWSPPMSFNLAFHVLLERRQGRLFTFHDLRAACGTDLDVLHSLLGRPAEELRDEVRRNASPEGYLDFLDAMSWRVGCAYYGFLKEVYVLAWVRRRGIDLMVHPLADTLFRVDFWTPSDRAVSLYVPNKLYADQESQVGRKTPMQRFVEERFSYKPFELPVPSRFGTVDLPPAALLDAILGWAAR